MKKIRIFLFFYLFLSFLVNIQAQDDCDTEFLATPFSSSVGMNYYAFDDGTPAKLNGIADKWRQFILWHNAGYSIGSNSYDKTTPFIFNGDWRYSVSNYSNDSERKINKSLFDLKANSEVTTVFSAFASSHPYLSPSYTLEGCDTLNNNWTFKSDPQDRDVIWRKPIPFFYGEIDNNNDNNSGTFTGMIPYVYSANPPILESFTDPESYRFFAEFLSFYTGMFGLGVEGTNTNFDELKSSGRYVTGATTQIPGLNDYMEIWNEPTAHWTKPNNYGYFTPAELAAMTHAAIGNSGVQTKIDSFNLVNVGIRDTDPSMKIVSPSLHDMDLTYYEQYLNALYVYRQDFRFDIHNFHHYSAYNASDLSSLLASSTDVLTSSMIVQAGMSRDTDADDICYVIGDGWNGGGDGTNNPPTYLETVDLEAAPSSTNAYWLCPELDGYLERGNTLYDTLAADAFLGENILNDEDEIIGRRLKDSAQVWVTEWGYPSLEGEYAKYPEGLGGTEEKSEETQARWIMRGFIEYNRSKADASFLHWLQDTGGNNWDTKSAGILNTEGDRKISWFYLKTLMNELGDKELSEVFALDGCELDFVPGVEINAGIVTPVDPLFDCPKIYQYSNLKECSNNSDCYSDYNDMVYAIWLPYMLNSEDNNSGNENLMMITLDELGLSNDLNIVQYYYVSPAIGLVDGMVSAIKSVAYHPLNNTVPGMIEIPVTEKPIFLHLRGIPESVCGNIVTEVPENCAASFSIVHTGTSCFQAEFKVVLDDPGGKCGTTSANINSVIASIGTMNDEAPNNIAVMANVQAGNSANEFIVTMAGLNPDTEYSFTFGSEYQRGNNTGYIGGETGTFITTNTNCFDTLGTSINCDSINFGKPHGNTTTFPIEINTGNFANADLNSLSIEGCIQQIEAGVPSGPCTPLPSGLFLDWEVGVGLGAFIYNAPVNNLTFGADYQIEIFLNSPEGIIASTIDTCSFSILPNNNFPSVVTQITPTLDTNCDELNVCFIPVLDTPDADSTTMDTTYVQNYTVYIVDAAGDYVYDSYVTFVVTDSSELCFPVIDVSDFEASDIFVQIIASGAGSSLSLFSEVELCCEATALTSTAHNSVSDYACKIDGGWLPGSTFHYRVFDFSNQSLACQSDYEVSATSNWDNFTFANTSDSNPDKFIFMLHAPTQTGYPCNITYTITVELGDGTTTNHNFNFTIPPFCCSADIIVPTNEPEIIRIEGLMSDPDFFYKTQDDKIVLRTDAASMDSIIQDSRDNGVEVYYALHDLYSNKPLKSLRKYNDKLEVKTNPNNITDFSKLYHRYEVHLLVKDKFYNLGFPHNTASRAAERTEEEKIKNEEQRIKVFPNPTSDNLTIYLNQGFINKVEVLSLTGQKMTDYIINDQSAHLNLTVGNGIYFLKITTVEGSTFIEKIIIQ